MVNTDLKHISEWSKQWLVKLNPTKTDIVYFNTRDYFFWIENTRIFSRKFRDTLNLSFRRTATCLDVFSIIVCMWFDHLQSALKVIPK
jgi:hypothetical protein